MRLKVVGVRSSRFFPLLVALFTRSEEFHSLKKILSPCSSSHRLRRWIWVDLPDPSSPSTAISRPGKFSSANVFIRRRDKASHWAGDDKILPRARVPPERIPPPPDNRGFRTGARTPVDSKS